MLRAVNLALVCLAIGLTARGQEVAWIAHKHAITQVDVLADGNRILSVSYPENTAKIWDPKEAKEIAVFQEIAFVSAIRKGSALFFAKTKGESFVLDVKTMAKSVGPELGGRIYGPAAVDDDGKLFAFTTSARELQVVSLEKPQQRKRLPEEPSYVTCVAFLPKGDSLLVGRGDGKVVHYRLQDLAAKELVLGKSVRVIAISPAGDFFAVAGTERLIHIYDCTTLRRTDAIELRGSVHTVRTMSIAKDGSKLAFADHNEKRFHVCGIKNGLVVSRDRVAPNGLEVFDALSFFPDGKLIASGGSTLTAERFLKIWKCP